MSRRISPELKAHLTQPVTTTCRLLAIVLSDGRRFGMTTLDQDVEYLGTTYSSVNGFDSSVIATDAGLSVDNAEGRVLLAADIPGITLEMVAAGELDNARWEMLLVNYRDLTMGHVIIDAGDLGEVSVQDGFIFAPELLSFAMRLRQSIGHYWSRNCRAEFGTPNRGQAGCGVNAEPLWQQGSVTGVHDEPFRVFADTALVLDPVPNTARVQWLSGPNAGNRLYQVEAYSETSGTIALVEPTPFRIQPGHGFQIRPDCDKTPDACKSYGNWLNFKGEPLIPVGEGVAAMTPGASVPGGFMGADIED